MRRHNRSDEVAHRWLNTIPGVYSIQLMGGAAAIRFALQQAYNEGFNDGKHASLMEEKHIDELVLDIV